MFWRFSDLMLIGRIAVLSFLFIFAMVIQGGADSGGKLNEVSYKGNIPSSPQIPISAEDTKIELNALLGILKADTRFKLFESMDKMISNYLLGEPTWKYECLTLQGGKETGSLNSELTQSMFNPYPPLSRYTEEGSAQAMFELLQSKVKRTEIFMLFRFVFNPKSEQRLLEMHLTPSSDKTVNVFIPF
jgi:hypothetical protein